MTNTEQVVETQQANVEFSPDQQRALEDILTKRLAQQARAHEQEMESLRREAIARVAEAKGTAVSVNSEIERMAGQRAKEAAERTELEYIFGNHPDAAKNANALAKKNIKLYRELRERATTLGLLGGAAKRAAIPMVGFRKT